MPRLPGPRRGFPTWTDAWLPNPGTPGIWWDHRRAAALPARTLRLARCRQDCRGSVRLDMAQPGGCRQRVKSRLPGRPREYNGVGGPRPVVARAQSFRAQARLRVDGAMRGKLAILVLFWLALP